MQTKRTEKPVVALAEDDLEVRNMIAMALERTGVHVTQFANGTECASALKKTEVRFDLLISDLRMPGCNGLELLKIAKELDYQLPVILVTGYGDIPTAVRTMREGAVDFLEKPLERKSFLKAVKSVLDYIKQPQACRKTDSAALTDVEREVLCLIMQGHTNKVIARIKSRSKRTIEFHRRNIMRKLNCDSLVDLIRKATAMGID